MLEELNNRKYINNRYNHYGNNFFKDYSRGDTKL